MVSQPRQLALPILELVPRNAPLVQENGDELVAAARARVNALLQALAVRRLLRILVSECEGGQINQLVLLDLHARFLLDFLCGAAGEGSAVVQHPGGDFGKGETAGWDAGLQGQEDVLVGFRVGGDVVGLEDELLFAPLAMFPGATLVMGKAGCLVRENAPETY